MDELPPAIAKRVDVPTTKKGLEMSPELELLDQLLGGPMSPAVLSGLFNSQEHFERAVTTMMKGGVIRLVDSGGIGSAKWQWGQGLADRNGWRIEITTKGIEQIEGKVR